MFGVAPLLNHVVMSEVLPDGSSVRTRDVGYAMTTLDGRFRPVNITHGPDGCLYVADWYDADLSHRLNNDGKLEPDSGRIYRIRARYSEPRRTIPRHGQAHDQGTRRPVERPESMDPSDGPPADRRPQGRFDRA